MHRFRWPQPDCHRVSTGKPARLGRGSLWLHGGELNDPTASATVKMATTDEGSHFEPHVVWVERGGTVTWELESGSHTTTAYAARNDTPQRIPEEARAWDSGILSEQGDSFEHTFQTTGVFDYLCTPHEATGMIGTTIVGNPKPDDQPGLRPPQDSLPADAAKKLQSLTERVEEDLRGSGGEAPDATSDEETSH